MEVFGPVWVSAVNPNCSIGSNLTCLMWDVPFSAMVVGPFFLHQFSNAGVTVRAGNCVSFDLPNLSKS